MGKGRKLRWNILVVLAAAAFLLFLGFIVLMVWGVRWMGGQKDFRRELADSIGDSVLEGVTATGPAGETSEPRLDDLNRLLLYITASISSPSAVRRRARRPSASTLATALCSLSPSWRTACARSSRSRRAATINTTSTPPALPPTA